MGKVLAGILKPGTWDFTGVVPTSIKDIESHTLSFPIRPMPKLSKLQWSFGGKSALIKRIQWFVDHVYLLHNLATPGLAAFSMARSMDMLWNDKCIQLDITGRISYMYVGLCGIAAVSFTKAVLLGRKFDG